MNFKKVALLIFLSITVFPAITSATPRQNNHVVYPLRPSPASRFFARLLSLGR